MQGSDGVTHVFKSSFLPSSFGNAIASYPAASSASSEGDGRKGSKGKAAAGRVGSNGSSSKGKGASAGGSEITFADFDVLSKGRREVSSAKRLVAQHGRSWGRSCGEAYMRSCIDTTVSRSLHAPPPAAPGLSLQFTAESYTIYGSLQNIADGFATGELQGPEDNMDGYAGAGSMAMRHDR